MKRVIIAATVAVMVLGRVAVLSAAEGDAKDAKPAKGDHQQHALVDMTVTGKLAKDEKPGKDGKPSVHYTVTDAQGAVTRVGGHHAKEGAAPAVNLEEYVGKDVTVTGKGYTTEREGKKVSAIVEVTKVEAAAAPAK